MKLLALDTALEACSVAVTDGPRPPIVISEVLGRGHAERLFGMLSAAMDEAGLSFDELDRIAVTVGPGSFTGLRVGIAAARGLALSIGCPVVGVETLEAHAVKARSIAGAVPVTAVIDARRDEVYGQRFAADGAPLGAPMVGTATFLANLTADGAVLAGGGSDAVLAASSGGRQILVVHRDTAPDIRTIAQIGAAAAPTDNAPRPLYLRPPDAKPSATAGVMRR